MYYIYGVYLFINSYMALKYEFVVVLFVLYINIWTRCTGARSGNLKRYTHGTCFHFE